MITGVSNNQNDKKYKSKNLSMDEKIKLFEEFIQKTGEPIIVTTVYKGVPIGRILISMRHSIEMGNKKYADRLEELGLLDERIDKIEKKIERISIYCDKNFDVWNAKTKIFARYSRITGCKLMEETDEVRMQRVLHDILEEYNIAPVLVFGNKENKPLEVAAVEELKLIFDNYNYIRSRKSRGDLKPEYEQEMKKTKVGGVFGVPAQIEELSEKTGISIDQINYIINEFGSIEHFSEIYKRLMIDGRDIIGVVRINEKIFESNKDYIIDIFGSIEKYKTFNVLIKDLISEGKVVSCFDIGKPGFVGERHQNTFIETLNESYKNGLLVNDEGMEAVKLELEPKEKEIFERFIALHEGSVLEALAREYNVSKTRIQQLRDRIRAKLLHPFLKKNWTIDLSDDSRRAFLERYFEEKDIFITEDSFILNEETKRDLLGIIKEDIEKSTAPWIITKDTEQDDKQVYVVDIYQTSIEELGFSKEAYIFLVENNCTTIKDIIAKFSTVEDLVRGKKYLSDRLREVIEKVHSLGLKLKFEMSEKELDDLNASMLNVADLKVSTRVANRLRRNGITSLNELISKIDSKDDLECKYHFSKKEKEELESEIHRVGLKFSYEDTTKHYADMSDIYKINLSALALSTRSYNALEKAGFRSLGDLVANIKLKGDLSRINGLGTESVREVRDLVHGLGLKFYYEVAKEMKYKGKKSVDEQLNLAIEQLQYKYAELGMEEERVETLQEEIKESPQISQKGGKLDVKALERIISENEQFLKGMHLYDLFKYRVKFEKAKGEVEI